MTRSLADTPEKLKPYIFHGVEINEHKTEARGDCPLCGKEGHFAVKTETGQFRCVRCETTGNVYTFLNLLLQESLAETTDEEYDELSCNRSQCDPSVPDSQRIVPVWALKDLKYAKSRLTGEWLIPTFNLKNQLTNLYRVAIIEEGPNKVTGEPCQRMQVMATPTCKPGLFGVHLLTDQQKHRRLQEGPWDMAAVYAALSCIRKKGTKLVQCQPNTGPSLRDKIGVLGSPGAGNFQEDWAIYFENCYADVCFDNDHPKKLKPGDPGYDPDHPTYRKLKGRPIMPGWDGQQRACGILSNARRPPVGLKQIIWGESQIPNMGMYHFDANKPDGYDARDCLKEYGIIKGMSYMDDLMDIIHIDKKPEDDRHLVTVEPIERQSFAELVQDYEAMGFCMSDEIRATLATVLAVAVSTTLGGDQLFLRVLGPPGSGKTTIAESFSAAREYTIHRSIMTGFHSGYTGMEPGKKRKEGSDSSLIPKMRDKTMFIKDADTLLQSPKRDQILSEFRDIYDRTSRAEYRNEVKNEYEDLNTTFVLCGTDELRTMNRTSLGERFLDIEIMARGVPTAHILNASMHNTLNKLMASIGPKPEPTEDLDNLPANSTSHLKAASYGFLKHLKMSLDSIKAPEFTEQALLRIPAIAEFVSYMRARVKRDGGELVYRPRTELATRLTSQFTKLAVCLAIVLGKQSVDAEVIAICQKVARDTAEGFQFEITLSLMPAAVSSASGGLSIQQISRKINLAETNVRRLLTDMQELQIVSRVSKTNNSGQRGRDMHMWQLSPLLKELYHRALSPLNIPAPLTSSSRSTAANRLPNQDSRVPKKALANGIRQQVRKSVTTNGNGASHVRHKKAARKS